MYSMPSIRKDEVGTCLLGHMWEAQGRVEVWHQIFDASSRAAHFHSRVLPVPEDLTPEEQQELENIRRRKQELLEDIQVMLA